MIKLPSRSRLLGLTIGLVAGWYAAGMVANAQRPTRSAEGTWALTLTPAAESKKAGEREQKVTLVVRPHEFTVTEWEKRGFKPAPYETDERRFGPAKFDGTLTNEKEGSSAKFTGTATGDQFEGQLTLKKKNGDTAEYTVKGQKK